MAERNDAHHVQLLDALAAELERPRELSAKVVNYIGGTYSIDYDDIGRFLMDEVPKLEDYELDLIFSPVFTPTLADQTVFAELLGSESVPRDQWPALIQQLISRPTRSQLVTADGQSHSVILREVTIERYVYRLRLEASIPESLLEVINRGSSASDRPWLKAIARRAAFEQDARRSIFFQYLTTAAANYSISDALELLNFVESSKPADLIELLARIPRRQEALRAEIDGTSSKPFFSERVQELHGGERDQRRQDDARISAKQKELEFLNRLQKMLASGASRG